MGLAMARLLKVHDVLSDQKAARAVGPRHNASIALHPVALLAPTDRISKLQVDLMLIHLLL